jgi:hypothetical protein
MPSRALRIGVLIGDSLVEEKLVDGPVTFGQALRCTISVPVDGVPLEHVLFDRERVLHLAPGMDGRVGVGDRVTAVETSLPIERGARGRLVVGDVTLLFQEVAKPAPQPRPQLPASIRGTFADRIDRRLAMIIGGSLLLHVGIAVWAWTEDAQAPLLGPPEAAARFEQATIDVNDVIEAPRAAVATPVAPPPRIVQPTRVVIPHHPDEPARLEDASRIASILAGPDAGDHGVGEMARHRPGADLAAQLDEAQHHKVTIGDGMPTSRDPKFSIDDRHDLPIHDASLETQTATHEQERGRTHIDLPKTDEPTSLTPQAVLDRINALYMSGLQRCYRRALVGDSRLGGTVAITFTVDEAGRVTDPEAAGVDAQVDACVTSQMKSWHFMAPRVRNQPAEATFHVSLALQPS